MNIFYYFIYLILFCFKRISTTSLNTGTTEFEDSYDEEKDINITNLIYILSIISEGIKEEQSKHVRLLRFKHIVIAEVKKQGKGGFLCNCVPGSLPEREFLLGLMELIQKQLLVKPHMTLEKLKYKLQMARGRYVWLRKTFTPKELWEKVLEAR